MPEIILLRHAESLSGSNSGAISDPDRPLTKDGAARMKRAAEGMKRLGLRFDRILTSPFRRALQTAVIVTEAFNQAEILGIEQSLAAGARWDKVRKALEPHSGCDAVLLVGHEPDLSSMAAKLIGAPDGSLAFGKGTLARIAVERIPPARSGQLVSLFTLRSLEAMAD